MLERGEVRLLLGLTSVTLLYILAFPVPSDTAGFWVGCSQGNFRPTDTCNRMCRLLGNFTSCCYGVNHASRSACSCCADTRNCPLNCAANCVMVQVVTNNCGAGNTAGEVPKREFSQLDSFYNERDLVPVSPFMAHQLQHQQQQDYMNEYLSKDKQNSPSYSALGSILSPYRAGNDNMERV